MLVHPPRELQRGFDATRVAGIEHLVEELSQPPTAALARLVRCQRGILPERLDPEQPRAGWFNGDLPGAHLSRDWGDDIDQRRPHEDQVNRDP